MNKKLSAALFLFIIFFAAMAVIQFSTPDLPDNDGFYHIKFAWLMRTEGLKPDFPYLPLSILNENDFYDHHFLYHVALIPFTFGDLHLGAKWAAVTFAALAFLAVWYLLFQQNVPFAWLWSLALLAVSEAFLFRMSIPRAQSLSLGVMALGLAWMFEGKYKLLAILSFLYVWMYDAFPLMLILAALYSASILILERRWELRPLLWVGLGIAAGVIVNPYFPNNLIFTYNHLLPKLQVENSIRVGNEWYPYDTMQLLSNSPLALIAFASGCLALGMAGRKMNAQTGTALFAALFFGLMLFNARRFVEYFPPFALIFSAFAWGSVLEFESHSFNLSLDSLRTNAPLLVIALAIVAGVIKSFPVVQHQLADSKPYTLYKGASAWLVANSTEGERVFQTDWDDFPRLFFYNTHNTYLVGLDPTYMQIYDANLYSQWVGITRGQISQPSDLIRSEFGSRYVISDLNHRDFIAMAQEDPGLREVYRDDLSVVYEVLEP